MHNENNVEYDYREKTLTKLARYASLVHFEMVIRYRYTGNYAYVCYYVSSSSSILTSGVLL
jgi:hypothetical protein